MSDAHTPEQRSRNMAAIKGKNTKPEILLRKKLWAKGLRYRLKSKLPGKPDLVFPSQKLVVFVDGCFWHRCPKHFIKPKTNAEFWNKKISQNVKRDHQANSQLSEEGWRYLRFWEHDIRNDVDEVVTKISKVVKSAR